jgi:3-oxoacyl-[acyl-carrier protein] reductase
MDSNKIILITGNRKGIGRFLTEYYIERNYYVIGCSRSESDFEHERYEHFMLNVSDEKLVKSLFNHISSKYGKLDILINNAGIASMNHSLLTSIETVKRIFDTNVTGLFLFSREAAKLMKKSKSGRIVNFSTVAVPIKLEGEAIYAASKAAVNTLTEILSREFASYNITVNAIGPTPVATDLIRNIPNSKMDSLIGRLPLKRLANFEDIVNIVDFFILPQSNNVTGQILYLGGV